VLRYRADVRTLCFVAAYFVALGWAWSVPLEARLRAGCALALVCETAWINAVITHNVVHLPLWRSGALNKCTRAVLTVTYGFAVNEYIPGHTLSHHRFLQQRRDVMRTTRVRLSWNLANILMFFPLVMLDVMRANAKYARFAREARSDWYRERNLQWALACAAHLTAVIIDYRRALLFVFVPHLCALWGITTVNYLWHDGCDVEHAHNHSRNFIGRMFNWLHFNNGFHGMHHLQPALHWSLLPAKHAKLLAPYVHPALEQKSFATYVLRTFVFGWGRLRYDGAPLVLPDEEGS
jgi:fatty acid desaturase